MTKLGTRSRKFSLAATFAVGVLLPASLRSEESTADSKLKVAAVLEDRSIPAAQAESREFTLSPAADSSPLSVPFVEGSESFGIRIPDIDSASGKMRSLLVIGALARLDDRLLEIKESYMQLFGRDGQPDFSISFPKATLDRFTRRLKSQHPVVIWTDHFHLYGDSMELDTTSREAVFEGKVRMVIYQLGGAFPKLGNETPEKEKKTDAVGKKTAEAAEESKPAENSGKPN